AQDHKRIFDGDRGPNTGGMGAYSPVPLVDDDLVERVMSEAIEPTLAALVKRGIEYRGVLYAGLMLTPEGPKMLEYNCRFGDPEAQAVVPRLTCDLADLLAEAADGSLATTPTVSADAAVTVVLATERYPEGPYRVGDRIQGLDAAAAVEGVRIFHAGTALDDEGQLITAGGRVLAVTALAPTLTAARRAAYDAAGKITWPGMQYRHDIASQAAKEART
ncbi:MAG: phosphoribosylamine--glycine ligase, partial [Actinomycetota bacterium]